MSKVVVRKNLNRWFKEKWVDVSRTDKDGKHPPCGRSKAKTSSKGYPKCRPSVKVSSKTPKTSGSMTSGQKRAATKRKRAKKQGVGGKPTIVKQELPYADANYPVSMTEVSNLMLQDAPQQCTIQDCPNPEAPPVVRARYRNPIGSQDYTHHMCEDCAHRHELGYMVQKGEPLEIAFDVLKEEYPFVAMAEDEKQLPVPMHTNRPRSTHPGFSRTDVFQVPTGVGIPTAQAAPRTVPILQTQGRIYPIADEKQYKRALRAPDEETRRAAMNEVPRVMTQAVQSGQNVFRMPTFYGMPFNEDTYFTTGEPMDLAFRLLKDDNPFLQNLDERIERVKQQHLNAENAAHEQFLARKFLALEQARNRMLGYSPRPFAEFSHEELESLMHDETGMQTPDQRKDLFNEVNTRNMENLNQFSDEFQDIYTGEPMDLAFRLLKRDMSHCNCNAPKGFSCRAHCKSKEKR